MSSSMVEIVKNDSQRFEYTYSAERQQEVEKIREKYLPKKEDKLERLKKLDRSAEVPGTVAALALGMLGALLFGVGMCCVLLWAESFFVLGIIVGILGILVLAPAYPLYKRMTKRGREKVAEEILALSAELSVGEPM